jgi:hypothetical protein
LLLPRSLSITKVLLGISLWIPNLLGRKLGNKVGNSKSNNAFNAFNNP